MPTVRLEIKDSGHLKRTIVEDLKSPGEIDDLIARFVVNIIETMNDNTATKPFEISAEIKGDQEPQSIEVGGTFTGKLNALLKSAGFDTNTSLKATPLDLSADELLEN